MASVNINAIDGNSPVRPHIDKKMTARKERSKVLKERKTGSKIGSAPDLSFPGKTALL
jgi:hypothetical protein